MMPRRYICNRCERRWTGADPGEDCPDCGERESVDLDLSTVPIGVGISKSNVVRMSDFWPDDEEGVGP